MLSREDIATLLDELADELETQGAHGDLFLVGGAAMALAYSRRRATRDLDAIFEPKQVIYDAAQRIGDRYGLPSDWLNDGVKGFLPGEDPAATVLFDRPGLAVRVASPRYLFAMKMLAARVERDEDDIQLLYELCGFRSVTEALDDVQLHYPYQTIPPKAQYLLQELFPADDSPGE
jgi:hypothetical protein